MDISSSKGSRSENPRSCRHFAKEAVTMTFKVRVKSFLDIHFSLQSMTEQWCGAILLHLGFHSENERHDRRHVV